MVPRSRLGAAKNGTRPSLNLVTAFAYKHRSTATIATTMPVANYKTYCKMLDRARAGRFAFPAIELVLEIETGAVGGEEDDVIGEKSAKLYTTPEDTLEVARRLNPIGGRYLLAATFGNVHGVYKPGHVKLKP